MLSGKNDIEQQRQKTFRLIFTGVLIGLSLGIKTLTFYVPIFSVPIFRISLNGPPSKLVSIIFGPIYGGIAGGIIDILGFFLFDKSGNAFMPALTLTAILNAFFVGVLWLLVKQLSLRRVRIYYFLMTGGLLTYGVVGLLYSPTGKAHVSSVVIIVMAILAVVMYLIGEAVIRYRQKPAFENYFLKLFIAIVIPGLFFNWVNTHILIHYFFPGKDAFYFALVRSAGQLVEGYYATYVTLAVLMVLKPLLRNKKIDI